MAAAHSNRSPSPLSSRPINPNPRNSESNPTIRRSFNGNNPFVRPSALTNQRRLDPNTPANSPSDFGRRRSVDKQGAAPPTHTHPKDFEEKENDGNDNVLRASKLQSPAKGCKNFMAPTISAASKFTPSPRKKVLVERNDPVRTSISLSDGKAMFFSATADVAQDLEPKSEMDHHQNQTDENFSDSNHADFENKKAAVVDSHRPYKKVTFAEISSDSQPSSEPVITDSDSLKVETEVAPSSSIPPLDADPSLPPYDPRTNYLSPRPQFIRYKPNPRVEMLLNKEKVFDPNDFDDSLMAEIMSEVLSDSDESADMVIGVDEEIEADVLHALGPLRSESLPVSTTPVDEICEGDFVVKNEKKPRRWFRLMCLSMIMILVVSVSVRHAPPSFDEVFVKDLSLNDLYEQSRVVVAAARLSFGNSVSLMLKLANELVEGKKRVPLQFMNLSDLQVDSTWKKEAYFLKRVEEYDFEEEELDAEMEESYADDEVLDTENDSFFEEEEAKYADAEYDDRFEDEVMATEETSAEVAELECESSQDIQIETEIVSIQLAAAAEASQSQETEVEAAIEVVAIDKQETEESSQIGINVGASDNGEAAILLDETSLDTPMAEESIIALHAGAISSLLAGVVGIAAAFIYYHQYKRNPTSCNVVQVKPVMASKQTETTTKKAVMEQEREVSVSGSYWETESEMSSSYHQIGNEVESSERKTRRKYSKRESLASSSGYSAGEASHSYGSFTTYERIPAKTNNGHGDEEMVTPVRRSSRIRNQVTSP